VSLIQPLTTSLSDYIFLGHVDDPLPPYDIAHISRLHRSQPRQDISNQTVSVEVMTITGNASTTVSQDPNIFYDSEILAIVHRSKSRSSGLASTKVWGWQGKRSRPDSKITQRLQDIALRYGTAVVSSIRHISGCVMQEILRSMYLNIVNGRNWPMFLGTKSLFARYLNFKNITLL
jgi:hypothetical protein